MIYNPYIIVPAATWAIAQVAKFTIAALRGQIDFRYLYASGGMPSVHSAVVCSLATTALLVDGVNSHLFGFTAIFAAIVMYDSFGVRRSAGEQAAAINMLIASLDRDRVRLEKPDLHLREVLGHQPREVTVGAIVGVGLAALFNYDRLGQFGTFLQTVPQRLELWAYTGIFALLLVVGLVTRLVWRARHRKSKTLRQLTRRVLVATQTTGWLGLATALLAYERASYLAWRLWSLVMLAVVVVWAVGLFWDAYRSVPAGLAQEAEAARKSKWLPEGQAKAGRKRRA